LSEPELEWQLEHLRVCADCSAWAEDVAEATWQLREASPEVPAASLTPPRHGKRLVGARLPAVAATVAVASVAAILAVHPARLSPSVSSHRSALGRADARLLPQDRLERLDGGFVFAVRTVPQRGHLEPT
jgi:hypothetical protein